MANELLSTRILAKDVANDKHKNNATDDDKHKNNANEAAKHKNDAE